MPKLRSTTDEVLTCDGCGKPIRDLGMAMVFWQADGPTKDSNGRPTANQLLIAHKDRQCSGHSRSGELSEELFWFASSEAAAGRLAGLTYGYSWSAAQLERLIGVAWAVPLVATPEQAHKVGDRNHIAQALDSGVHSILAQAVAGVGVAVELANARARVAR